MNVTEKMMSHIIARTVVPAAVTKGIEYYQSIHVSREAVSRKIAEEKKRHDKAMAVLNATLAGIRSRCPHPDVTYYPDASGNNDSFEVCELCGAEAHRLSYDPSNDLEA